MTFIRKSKQSGDTNCPALHRTDRGTFIVQGSRVFDPAVIGQLRHRKAGEVAIEVPADVLAEIAAAALFHG